MYSTSRREGSPLSTRVRYNYFISFLRRLGRLEYMLEPLESTMCLRISTAAI